MYDTNQTSLVCVTNANDAELRQWWTTLQADDVGRRWFSDTFPKTYADFLATLTSGEERYTLFFNGDQVAGSYWLHDLVDDDPEVPLCAWLRGYVAPTYRGNFTAEAWPVARAMFEAWGYRHLFAASHAENKRAIACLTKNMNFTFVDNYPDFAIYEDQPTRCAVCVMRADDVDLARYMAQQRSSRLVFSV
ncbi:hypothetical protein C2W62_31210 [Candidatus Entotheonella serta]|nr:hypothetical protein C2W62_31210 [Candidatus Entotheonella serta]